MLSVRLLVDSRLLVNSFEKSKVTCGFSTAQGVGAPNAHVVQGSTVVLP